MKLVIDEPESAALEQYFAGAQIIAVSRIALVEVPRATRLANPDAEVVRETERLLRSCMLVALTDDLLSRASHLTSASVRTLDAIHLASALLVGADELVAYDRRLIEAGVNRGLSVAAPGAST